MRFDVELAFLRFAGYFRPRQIDDMGIEHKDAGMLEDPSRHTKPTTTASRAAGRADDLYGLAASDVGEFCALFLRDNFPQLGQEARRLAHEQVQSFAMVLEQRLVLDADGIDLEKFRQADVQAALNDAVQACARRGSGAHPQILSALISERVARQSNEFKDLVLSETVLAAPRLTGPQIALLSFLHIMTAMSFQGLRGVEGLEVMGQTVLQLAGPGFNLSDSQKQHMQYAGAAIVTKGQGGDLYESQSQLYKYLGIVGRQAFREALERTAPTYLRLIEQFTSENLFQINLTSVGQAIALANLTNHLARLDYGIWLK